MIQFIRTLPDSLFEAARIDGASEWRIFTSLVVPLSMPIIATLFLLAFQFHWNNFLWQLIVTTDEKMYTVPVGLAMFRSAYEEQYALKMAASSVSIIPIAAVFLVTQRFFIEGMTKGAVKG
jgi:multiple sugar transport system permease protein